MRPVATTKMSSKGQVVIPERIRQRLGLETGTQFIVLGEDGVVILKRIKAPSASEFDRLLKNARAQAKAASLRPVDIAAVVAGVRKRR